MNTEVSPGRIRRNACGETRHGPANRSTPVARAGLADRNVCGCARAINSAQVVFATKARPSGLVDVFSVSSDTTVYHLTAAYCIKPYYIT